MDIILVVDMARPSKSLGRHCSPKNRFISMKQRDQWGQSLECMGIGFFGFFRMEYVESLSKKIIVASSERLSRPISSLMLPA